MRGGLGKFARHAGRPCPPLPKREDRILLIRHRLVGDKALGYRLLVLSRMPGGLPSWAFDASASTSFTRRGAGGGDRLPTTRPLLLVCRAPLLPTGDVAGTDVVHRHRAAGVLFPVDCAVTLRLDALLALGVGGRDPPTGC